MESGGSVSVDAEHWRLSERVTAKQRAQLLRGPSFEQIVERIASEMRLVALSRERARKNRLYFRAVLTIEVHASTVDLFHNSASGYRAQYYSSIKAGERANLYALKTLAPRIVRLSKALSKRTCQPGWLARSITDPSAKLWIHQGLWLRHAKSSDAVLLVSRWLKQCRTADPKRRKKAFWATLAPRSESRIDIKGAYFSKSGHALGTLKPSRAADIRNLGFT
jgi:hypothetical protein